MAVAACAKCNGHIFERSFVTPLREQSKVPVLQCADCGALVGTLGSEMAIDELQRQLAAIDAGLTRIAKALSEQ
jgi:hypothetical protein